MKARCIAFGLLVAVALGGCGGDDAEAPGRLEQALARTRGPWVPGEAPLRPFAGSGPHTMTLDATLRIDAPTGEQRLQIRRVIDRGPELAYRVEDRRTWTSPSVNAGNPARVHDDQVSARFDGQAFALQKGDGPWLERDVLDGHAERFLTQAYDLQTFVLGGLGDYLRWRDIGPGEDRPASVSGLPVTWREASLDPAVRPKAMSADALAALRDHTRDWTAWVGATHRPMRVEGRLAFTERGEVAMGRLELVGVASVDGVEATFSVTLAVAVTRLDAKLSFELPADRLPIARPRPWKMIEDVLGEDLAPIYRPH